MSDESLTSLLRKPSASSDSSIVSEISTATGKSQHGGKKSGVNKQRVVVGPLAQRLEHKIFFNGADVTPMTLQSSVSPAIPFVDELPHLALDYFDSRSLSSESVLLHDAYPSSIHVMHHAVARDQSTATLASLTSYMTGMTMSGVYSSNEDLTDGDSSEMQGIASSIAPSAFQLPLTPPPKPRLTSTVQNITLTETPTFLLLERPSYLAQVDTSDAERVLVDNRYYEQVTSSRGLSSRTMVEAEMQTTTCLHKSRATWLGLRQRKNKASHATTYMIYDAEAGEGGAEDELADRESLFSYDDVEYQKLAATTSFKAAATKMERVLASNVFDRQQRVLKGYCQPDPLRLDVDFKYKLKLLWTFSCDAVAGRAVTALCWNPANGNLLAVGYGKFHYNAEVTTGLVCCWSVKNPTNPERVFRFGSPITALDFSKEMPNLLGVAMRDGSVHVLDVTSEQVISKSQRKTSPSYEPVWNLIWYPHVHFNTEEEQILVAGQDGRVSKYRNDEDFTCQLLMRLFRMEGEVKGIERPRQCRVHDIPVSQYPAALALAVHDGNYYVGTDEGAVHKCSLKNVDQQLDLFVAHTGPIYSVEFSPFCQRVFVTCGADWCVRVWAEGVYEPLVTFTTSMDSVQGATWSPINATVLASIAGDKIHIWDLTRKTFVPASETSTDALNTVVQFTKSGDSLLVGDVAGVVHVYALEDMPFSQHYQQDTLVDALLKALKTRPDIVAGLKKTGPPFAS